MPLRIVLIVALVQFVNVLDFMMVMPLGPDFATGLGFAPSLVGVVGGVYTLAAAVAGLAGARFLDRFDRRKALMVCILGLAVATALGGLAFDLGTLLAARVLAGLFGGPATSLALAIVADVVPHQHRGRAMGVVMAGFSVASVLGVPAGLAMARHGDWRTPFLVVGGLAAAAAVAARYLLPSLTGHLATAQQTRARAGELLARADMRWALCAAALMSLSVFTVVPHVSTYLQYNLEYPRSGIETLYLVGGLVNLVVLQITGRATDRFGPIVVSIVGMVLLVAAVTVGFAITPPPLPVMAFFILFMISSSPRFVPLQTVATRLPAAHERAQYMSLQSATQHLASSAGAGLSSLMLTSNASGQLSGMTMVAVLSIALSIPVPWLLRAASLAKRGES